MPAKRKNAKQTSPNKKAKVETKDGCTTQTGEESELTSKSEKGNKQDNTLSKNEQIPSEQLQQNKAETDDSFLISHLTDSGWKDVLQSEMMLDYFKKMETQLQQKYLKNPGQVFPPKELIFNALNLTPFQKVKVVILGQDPYHDDGQAHGLSFSVPAGVKPPPSLQNIYKELHKDIKGFSIPDHGNLENWATQGVLLLNATLTVCAHQPNSHAKIGWQRFTDAIISAINAKSSLGCVFILWGGFAQKKEKLIDTKKHHVIKAAHPSPLSFSKFLGCGCFSDANKALQKIGHSPIDWTL